MAKFKEAIVKIFKHEGGYQNASSDRGNYDRWGKLIGTNMGITPRAFERFVGISPLPDVMKSLNKELAESIYRYDYWNRIKGDEMEDQSLAELLFDGNVNQGNSPIRSLQRIVGTKPDAIVGPITLSRIKIYASKHGYELLFEKLKSARRLQYHLIVARRPIMRKWLRGWLRRLDSYTYNEEPKDFNKTAFLKEYFGTPRF